MKSKQFPGKLWALYGGLSVNYRNLSLSISFAFIASSAYAEERDPYGGEWGGSCGKQYPCWHEIGQKGAKNYDVRWVMADRLAAKKVFCEEKIAMKRRPLKFDANNQYPDSLAGSMKSDPFLFILPGEGSVNFVTESFCRGERFGGEYAAIGH
ncbi:hypothetical protein [Aliirhizobium smilacinae]|uniref:Uncharacterized protein n=1 Tax=Aliirhizobium smilacinae TaxID=1395944 RepID=A0A5C4X9A0_9HYPH|nr:hypothetical protein [Rhizobium smilacinae]TNM59859.1 hypothetical protein FHP24_27180 [Rhizobium smilacinae]